MEAVALTLRSIFPQHPGRWLLTRVSFYVLVALIAVAGFFIFPPLFVGGAMEASPMRTAETVLLHWVLDFLAVVCVAVGAWLGGSRWRPKVQVERAVAGVGGTGWAEDALRRYNFELIQAERLRSRKVMEQAMTVALRGYRGMEPPDIAKIVSRVIAEMNELNEIAEQRRQQAVDRPTPFTSVP